MSTFLACPPCVMQDACRSFGSCFRTTRLPHLTEKLRNHEDRCAHSMPNVAGKACTCGRDDSVLELVEIQKEIARLTEANRLLKEEMDTKDTAYGKALVMIGELMDIKWGHAPQLVRQIEDKLDIYICWDCRQKFDTRYALNVHVGSGAHI